MILRPRGSFENDDSSKLTHFSQGMNALACFADVGRSPIMKPEAAPASTDMLIVARFLQVSKQQQRVPSPLIP